MKRAIVALVLVAGTGVGLRAGDDTAKGIRVQDRIPAMFPPYSREEHLRAEAEKARAAAETLADPDLVVLPLLTVQQKVQQRMELETLYQRGAYDEELVKRELSEFDRYFLNRFQLGLNLGFVRIGIVDGNEARAREAYLVRKRLEREERIERLATVVATSDEREAAELRRLNRAARWSERPTEVHIRPINMR